ncbi:MAG: ABC transporter substrate-binding protein [Christensenellales bacterium]|jgi:raffinose/stachyose/melibiose transport system substrate-binding protein|nr:extracellular solute-binding protein [Christensenellaceae bacterium]
MKRVLATILSLVILIGVLPIVQAESETITVRTIHYMVEGEKAAGMETIQKLFSEKILEEEGKVIKFENSAYSQGTDYWPQLNSSINASDFYDIMMGNPGLYTDLIKEGYVKDLTGNEVIKNLGLTSGDMGDVSYEGKWYAYPVDFKSWGVFYNVKMFEELGIDVPKTESELLAICEKLQENNISPWAEWYADGASVDINMRTVLWTKALANGDKDLFKDLMSGDKTVHDYPYMKEALETWARRIGNWARPDAVSNKQTDANEIFVSGKAGMLYQGTWNIGSIEGLIKDKEFEYGFFLCPTDDSGQDPVLNVQVDQAFMINPKANNPDYASKFMEFWLTDCMGLWSDASFQPGITGAKTENTPPLLLALLEAKASGNTACYGDFTVPFTSAFTSAYRTALTAFAASIVTGETQSGVNSVETCLDYMQELFDEEIAKAAL